MPDETTKNFMENITTTADVRVLLTLIRTLTPEVNITTMARVLETDIETIKRILRNDPDLELDQSLVLKLPRLVALMGQTADDILKQTETLRRIINAAKLSNVIFDRISTISTTSPEMMMLVENVLGIYRLVKPNGAIEYATMENPCDHDCASCGCCAPIEPTEPFTTSFIPGDPPIGIIHHPNREQPKGITVEQLGGKPDVACDENGYPLPEEPASDTNNGTPTEDETTGEHKDE